jgi:hypothetical protein
MIKQDPLYSDSSRAVSRRKFAKSAAAAGVALGASAFIDGPLSKAEAQALTDADILNFALNLEYLEAEFYTVLTSGMTIEQHGIGVSGVGTPGPTTGATRLDFRGDRLLEQTALELAYDERQHVLLIRQALGAAAVAKPAIDFAPAAVTTIQRFLQAARVFEDVGVSAYGGAAPLIQSKDILAVATRIALVEALHAGNIRLQVADEGVRDFGPVDAVDIIVGSPATPRARLISADTQGLAPVRTPSQVLSILYGPGAPSGTTRGLFFPNGLNGTIRTV